VKQENKLISLRRNLVILLVYQISLSLLMNKEEVLLLLKNCEKFAEFTNRPITFFY